MEELGSSRLMVEVCQRAEDYLNEGHPKNERGGSQGECLTVQHFQPIHWRDMDDYENRNTGGVREHTNPDINDINNDVEHTISGIGDVGGAGADTDPDVSDTNDAEGHDVNKRLDPTKARQDLLDEILQADVPSLSLRESTSLLLLELQAANEEEDQSEGHVQPSTADNKGGGSPYQNGRLIDHYFLEKPVTPDTLKHLRNRHPEETKAVEPAQPHVEAAKSAHAMAVQRAVWVRKEFEDVFNTISKEMEGGGAGTPPSCFRE
ncbi:hypothetical protein NW755_014008 [Fusarium falciforme]|uniref:Uncharacterized protein n=1 Tax=Fusarium falciforme TaxID=195108 RepID=A0A9W8QUZ1_9HYPO|nr:hypothetical protein NW755_014008 [Fusarium falciforme]